jgi:hypothetical protein
LAQNDKGSMNNHLKKAEKLAVKNLIVVAKQCSYGTAYVASPMVGVSCKLVDHRWFGGKLLQCVFFSALFA